MVADGDDEGMVVVMGREKKKEERRRCYPRLQPRDGSYQAIECSGVNDDRGETTSMNYSGNR